MSDRPTPSTVKYKRIVLKLSGEVLRGKGSDPIDPQILESICAQVKVVAEAARRLHRPEPRVELGERLRRLAHAAIDVSDGLAGDLGHILARSRVGATIEYERIPRGAYLRSLDKPELEKDCVLSGGDD